MKNESKTTPPVVAQKPDDGLGMILHWLGLNLKQALLINKHCLIWTEDHWRAVAVCENQEQFSWRKIGKPYKVVYFIGSNFRGDLEDYINCPAIPIVDPPEPIAVQAAIDAINNAQKGNG